MKNAWPPAPTPAPSVSRTSKKGPDDLDMKDINSIKGHIKRLLTHHGDKVDIYKDMLKQLEESGLKPGSFAFHKHYGNCIITKMWPRARDKAIFAAISSKKGSQAVKLKELMKPSDNTEILYSE